MGLILLVRLVRVFINYLKYELLVDLPTIDSSATFVFSLSHGLSTEFPSLG